MCVVRYKQQLSAGLKRELALEQMLVQVELEWQRSCEDMKVEHYLANEQLIQDLTQAKDQVSLSCITQPPFAQFMWIYWCTGIFHLLYLFECECKFPLYSFETTARFSKTFSTVSGNRLKQVQI